MEISSPYLALRFDITCGYRSSEYGTCYVGAMAALKELIKRAMEGGS